MRGAPVAPLRPARLQAAGGRRPTLGGGRAPASLRPVQQPARHDPTRLAGDAPAADAYAEDAFTIYFDGECPLCRREIDFLARRDAPARARGAGRLRCVDIAAPDFDAAGRSRADLMARIHGRLPDGTWVEGMEVFRRAYAAVDLGWLLAPSRWPLVGRLFDAAYRWFARHRLRLTGRTDCEGACAAPGGAAERR